jgi:hypothetical protein
MLAFNKLFGGEIQKGVQLVEFCQKIRTSFERVIR